MRGLRYIIFIASLVVALSVGAQRRITPIGNPDNKPKVVEPQKKTPDEAAKPQRPASVVEQHDSQGRVVLVDTISGVEYRDTINMQAPKTIYPKFAAVSVGVNMFDGMARLVGQQYGIGGVWAELSIHNWFKPMVEFGLGSADYTPKNESYRYVSPTAPYFKLGLNYNFLYNSTPDYSVYVGLRYGLSSFSYRVDDVTNREGYWNESVSLTVPSQKALAGYFEFLFGLRVQMWRNFSLGWEVKGHSVLHQGKHSMGDPWYIPGYGTKSSIFSGAISLSYTLPLGKKESTTPTESQK